MRLFLLMFVGLSAAKQVPQCHVGEWSEWSECTSAESPCDAAVPYSFPSVRGPKTSLDRGRLAMEGMMAEKSRLAGERVRCLAEGTCPELMPRPSKTGAAGPCIGGIADGSYPCENVDLMSFLNFEDLGATEADVGGTDIWGWVDPLTDEEYALHGLTTGTSFVRITDPVNPVPLAFLPTETVASGWRDVKVVGNWAFIGSEALGHGLQIYDLTQLRTMNGPVETVTATRHYPQFSNSHNIVNSPGSSFVYAVGCTRSGVGVTPCSGGLHAVDISDPNNPVFAGCFDTDGYTHDAQCVMYQGPDAAYSNQEICFNYNEDTLTIVDVSDKANMVELSRTEYTNSEYTHQGWLSEDHQFLLLDDELDETRSTDKRTRTLMWDVRDLTNPVLVKVYYHAQDSIDHNQYIKNGISYQANYESGVRLMVPNWDVAPTELWDLEEVGFFDVFPSMDTATFRGSWTGYPYFPSGTLVVSSMDYGLFILRPDFGTIGGRIEEFKNKFRRQQTLNGVQTRYREIMSKDLGAQCPALSMTQAC